MIGLANSGADTLNTIKQAREFGLGIGQQQAGVHALAGADYRGAWHGPGQRPRHVHHHWVYWDQDEQTRAFSRRYFERMKKMPSMMQAAVYSAVLH